MRILVLLNSIDVLSQFSNFMWDMVSYGDHNVLELTSAYIHTLSKGLK